MLFYLNNELKITGYMKIKLTDNSNLTIINKKGFYIIKGEHLKICYFSKDEMIIKGKIDCVEIND